MAITSDNAAQDVDGKEVVMSIFKNNITSIQKMNLSEEEKMQIECALSEIVFKRGYVPEDCVNDYKFSVDGKRRYAEHVESLIGIQLAPDMLDAMYRFFIAGITNTRDPSKYDLRTKKCCEVCGATDVTVDHKIPIAKGGTNHIRNLQYLCGYHNSMKNARIAFVDLFTK